MNADRHRGWRNMLRLVRDAVAAEAPAPTRLGDVVRVIAQTLAADVCSLYLRQRDGGMALAATHGLRSDAVFHTRLAPGEGLVGLAAGGSVPVAVRDVQSHPAFAYRPETEEDPYNTFIGAPLLRGGAAIGVLVVQHRDDRAHSEDDLEAVAIVGALMAEVAADPEFAAFVAGGGDAPAARLTGQRLSPGLAIGVAAMRDPPLPIQRMVAEDAAAEIARLERAVVRMRRELDDLLDDPSLGAEGEHRDVLDAFRLAAGDDAWIRRVRANIENGMTAEVASRRVQTEARSRLRRAQSALLRDRLADLDDLAGRLARGLAAEAGDVGVNALPENAVLFAHALGPAELLELDRSRLAGLVLEEGSASAHVAIVARALGVPALGRASGALVAAQAGDPVILDADRGQALLRPARHVRQGFETSLAVRAARSARGVGGPKGPVATRDGETVEVFANAGLLMDMETAFGEGAEGIGLFRTELSFLGRTGLPSEEEQSELYREAIRLAGGRSVAFRTFDHGGDKTPAALAGNREANPALGWRALRIALDMPETLRSQLYALATAAAGETLEVMFPMAAEASEIAEARAVLRRALEQATADDRAPARVRVGVAIETPSLVWQGARGLRRVDFATVGTNDLLQFAFAADRDGPRVAGRYDALSPPALAMLRHVARSAEEAETPLSVCGEMASDPLGAIALIGLGIRRLSTAPNAVRTIRETLSQIDAVEARHLVEDLMDSEEHSVRDQMAEFAESQGLPVDDMY